MVGRPPLVWSDALDRNAENRNREHQPPLEAQLNGRPDPVHQRKVDPRYSRGSRPAESPMPSQIPGHLLTFQLASGSESPAPPHQQVRGKDGS